MKHCCLCVILLALFLSGCSSEPTGVVSSPVVGPRWVLMRLSPGMAQGESTLSDNWIIFKEDGSLSGREEECNSIFGTYSLSSATISMVVGGTKIACPGIVLREYLNDAVRYSLETEHHRTVLRIETTRGLLTFRRE